MPGGYSALAQTRPTIDQVNIEKKLIEGKKFAMLGDWEKAESIFKAILAEDVQNSVANYELSRTLAGSGKLVDALSYIRKAIRLEPDNEWYLLMEADIHEKNNDLFSSMTIYDQLIQLRPDRPHYYEMLISFSKRTGEKQRLLNTLDKYEQVIGINEAITRSRFETLDGMGRTEEALAAINRLTEIYPSNIEYKYLAASYCRTKGLDDQAMMYYKQIVEIDPLDSRARLALAGAEKEEGNKAGYLQSISPIITNPSLSIDVKLQELIPYVLEYSDKKDPSLGQALIDVSKQLVTTHPKEAKAFAMQGDVLSIVGKNEGAVASYITATQLNGNIYAVWEQLISLLISTYNYEEVITQSAKAMDIFPNQAYLYYAGGYGAYKKRQYEDALDLLRQALIMTGKNNSQKISVYNVLGMVYDELGQPDKSIEAFETALSLNPHSAETMSQYSLVLSRRIEQSEKALSMADKLFSDGNQSAMVHQWIAEVFYNQKKYDKASQSIQVAIQKGTDAYGYNLAGDILIAVGDTNKALEMWQTALNKGFPEVEVKKKLSDHKSQ
ncbi:MAG: tetratricopeptide repeat protein [Saprospiraceae bacterium]